MALFFFLPPPAAGLNTPPVVIDKSAGAISVEHATFQAFLVRKYFVKGINYLDERYGEFGCEPELCFQIRRASRKTLALPQVTALYTPGSPYSDASRTIFQADRIHGTAVYFSKHYGLLTGLLFRIKAILKALFSFRWALFGALISGTKIDGSQSDILYALRA